MSDTGGGGVRLSRLATGHRACAARSGLYCLAPLLHPRPQRGMGFVRQGWACAAMRKRAVTYTRRHKHHAGQQQHTAPGWREPPRGADGPQPGAAWTRQRQALLGWAGANTTDCAERA
jgi:hypothetical protein